MRKPCDWAKQPGEFGVAGGVAWREGDAAGRLQIQLHEAQQHHRIARRVSVRMARRHMNQRGLAHEIGVSPQQAGRILHGEIHLLLRHVLALEVLFPNLNWREDDRVRRG